MMLLLLTSILPSALSSVSVSPCCPPSSYLDISSSLFPSCQLSFSTNQTMSSITLPGLHVDDDMHRQEEEITLVLDREDPGMPDCREGMEIHFLERGSSVVDTWVTTSGQLATAKYDVEFDHGDFCVDLVTGGHLVAVMCNPCSWKVPCIHLCCPHGQAFIPNTDYNYNDFNSPSFVCDKVKGGLEYRPEVWHKEEDRILDWERNKNYILVAPELERKEANGTVGFQCPKEYGGLSWAPEDIGDFKIVSDGSLRGSNLPDYAANVDGSVVMTSVWSQEKYCMIIGSPPDYDYGETAEDTSDELKLTFMHCLKPDEESWQEKFTRTFHPVALSISIAFLFFTLIVYFLEKGLRETLIGKITIGFIINLTCCFIIITDNYIKFGDKSFDRRETFPCILSGYLILYFFNAFFFWLNAMVIHIWLPLSSYQVTIAKFAEKKRFLFCFLYAQGLPVIICAIIAIIDASGKGKSYSELQLYPEMGVYSCFLGSQKTNAGTSYFSTPVFLYHQSVIILIQISNLVFLMMTCRRMCTAGDRQEEDRRKKEERMLQHFSLFVKLFFILGFHWTADLLSTALAEEHGFDDTFYVRFFLDLVNLFAGVLIFVVLICNKPVLSSVRHRLCGDSSQDNRGDIQMSVDQEQLSSSAKDKENDTAV